MRLSYSQANQINFTEDTSNPQQAFSFLSSGYSVLPIKNAGEFHLHFSETITLKAFLLRQVPL